MAQRLRRTFSDEGRYIRFRGVIAARLIFDHRLYSDVWDIIVHRVYVESEGHGYRPAARIARQTRRWFWEFWVGLIAFDSDKTHRYRVVPTVWWRTQAWGAAVVAEAM